MAVIKIDGFDIYTYTRVAPGEGLDIADTDFLDPQFGSSAAGAGNPLLSVKQGNREITIPVHLRSPDKTKDALHLLVADLNRRLANAKVLEWKDDGATNSSFLDIEFGRFEPEFNKRRQDAGWMSGIVRLFTHPFARRVASGYFTTWTASTAATGLVGSVAIATYNGDAPGQFQFVVNAASAYAPSDGRIVGAALVPSGYVVDWAAASLIRLSGATLMGWTGAAGSQVVAQGYRSLPSTGAKVPPDIARIIITNASSYAGLNRVLLVGACDKPNVGFGMYDAKSKPNSLGIASSIGEQSGFNTVDLGIVNIDPTLGATKVLTFYMRDQDSDTEGMPFKNYANASSVSNNFARINRVVILPEDSMLVVDSQRQTLSRFVTFDGSKHDDVLALTIDDLGNTISSPTQGLASSTLWKLESSAGNGLYAGSPVGVSVGLAYLSGAIEVNVPTTSDLTSHICGGIGIGSSNRVIVGKYVSTIQTIVGARLQTNPGTPSLYSMQIVVGNPGLVNPASVGMVACVAVPYGIPITVDNSNAGFETNYDLKVWQRGPVIDARLIGGITGSVVATLSASHADAGRPGTGWVGMASDDTGAFGARIYGFDFSAQPSSGHLGGDIYTLDTDARTIIRGINAKFSLDGGMRGGFIQRSAASTIAAAVVINLPLDGGPTNQNWSFGVAENEYFTYAVV